MRVTTYGLVEMVQMRGHKILSHRDSSDEGSQHMILWRINKSYPYLLPNTLSYLNVCVRHQVMHCLWPFIHILIMATFWSTSCLISEKIPLAVTFVNYGDHLAVAWGALKIISQEHF